MIVIMKSNATNEQVGIVENSLKDNGLQVQVNNGVECVVLGVIGDTSKVDKEVVSMLEGVERVMQVQESYKKANRKFHPYDSIIKVRDVNIGGDSVVVMAGPCSVESREQINSVAKDVKKDGARILRGGAFKPRTSPYSFQGLEEAGLDMLLEAGKQSGLPVVTELMSAKHLELFDKHVDIIQIGARNMQNYDLLKELGNTSKPILLKRGFAATIDEWLMSAEYIMSSGNPNVILCERGIRTFETFTRNTLDLSSIPAVKKLSHLPIIVDPSHATGMSWMVEPMAMAAVAAGADGLIIEVHNNPCKALCDGPQSLEPKQFNLLMQKLKAIASVVGKSIN